MIIKSESRFLTLIRARLNGLITDEEYHQECDALFHDIVKRNIAVWGHRAKRLEKLRRAGKQGG